ncbi:hypothetical protein HK405_014432, partial [Cladochytrium tenue]
QAGVLPVAPLLARGGGDPAALGPSMPRRIRSLALAMTRDAVGRALRGRLSADDFRARGMATTQRVAPNMTPALVPRAVALARGLARARLRRLLAHRPPPAAVAVSSVLKPAASGPILSAAAAAAALVCPPIRDKLRFFERRLLLRGTPIVDVGGVESSASAAPTA